MWQNYPRYLRSLQIRTERLNSDYAKDCRKLEAIEFYINEFALALEQVEDITNSQELYNYWLLLEEARIATFTPEVPVKIKNVLAKLESACNNLH